MPAIETVSSSRKYTIGFLPQQSTGFGGFQDMVWRSMVEAGRKRGVNALVFAGGSLDNAPYNPWEKNYNLVYDLISHERVDGLIVNFTIGNFVSPARFLDFCRGFGVPLVTIIGSVEGFPSVRVDNRSSIRDVILHLVNEHKRKQIAFIRGTAGNPDAEERFAVYRETLAECRMPYDPDLVFNGQFEEVYGVKAVEYFLKLKDKTIDAIVASNDGLAFGAINTLRAHGKRVPWDVSVTGFDDTDEAGAFTPALTTVRQPFDEICDRALDILCRNIESGASREAVAIPARLVLRQSCGCSSALLMTAAEAVPARAPIAITGAARGNKLGGITEVIARELIETAVDDDERVLGDIVEEFILDVQNEHPGAFLEKMKMILQEKVVQGKEVHAWQHALYILRKWASLLWTDEKPAADAENKILQACVLVGESSKQTLAYQKILIEKKAKTLREVSQELITTFDFNQLKDVIRYQLTRLDIQSCFISVFRGGAQSNGEADVFLEARPAEAATKNETDLGYKFHALPARDYFPTNRRYTYAVHPLYFKERRIGYAMFELGPEDGVVYDALQVQISSSLMGSELIRQREKAEAAEKKRSDSIAELVRPMLDSISAMTATAREKIGVIGELSAVTKENNVKLNMTNDAIQLMSERIEKMSDVIGIIDDISARVNILAINTSIESAHAGQFGKGFAVIAGEIRKLADSIKNNATVIDGYLKDIRPAIDLSRKAGDESREAFRRLEKDVLDVAQTLNRITASMDDLSANSTQILTIMNAARE
jgi:DNA-binding LacI/PurR family transcriptional regulator